MTLKRTNAEKAPNFQQAIEIWLRRLNGEHQHHIAADYGFNQGRISEIKKRTRHPAAFEAAMEKVTKH